MLFSRLIADTQRIASLNLSNRVDELEGHPRPQDHSVFQFISSGAGSQAVNCD